MLIDTRSSIRFSRATSNFRALPLALLVWIGYCKHVLLATGSVHTPMWVALVSPVILLFSISSWRMRVPKSARRWTNAEGESLLPRLLPEKFATDVLVRAGGPGAQVRGGILGKIVLNEATANAWRKNESIRNSQYAHECGHIGFGDTVTYGLLSTGLLLVVVQEVYILFVMGSSSWWLSLCLLVLALGALRDYSRHRELSADRVAAAVVGASMRQTLDLAPLPDEPRFPFLSTHPTLMERVRALDDPLRIASERIALPLFNIGMMTALAVGITYRMLHAFISTDPRLLTRLALVAIAIPTSLVISRSIQFAIYALANWVAIRWMASFTFGLLVGTVLARGDWADSATLLSALVVLVVLPVALGAFARAVLFLFAAIDVFSKREVFGGWTQRLFLAIPFFIGCWATFEGLWSEWLRMLVVRGVPVWH